MKISVITPAFNAATHIHAAIASVQAQSYQYWEMIIVNDGSIDETAAILDEQDDPRIRVIHQPNRGVSVARNAGLDAARGRYVTFLDADDRLPPDALTTRARFLDNHLEVDIVNGGVTITRAERVVRQYMPDLQQGPFATRLARLEEGVFMGPFYMVRRDRIGQHRFPIGVSHCEDIIFFLTLAQSRGLCYGAVVESVYEYRLNSGSAMSNLDGLEAGYLDLLGVTAGLDGIDESTRLYQYRRIRRILILTWVRRGRPVKALRSVLRVYRAFENGHHAL